MVFFPVGWSEILPFEVKDGFRKIASQQCPHTCPWHRSRQEKPFEVSP